MRISGVGEWLDQRLTRTHNPLLRRALLLARLTVDVFQHLIIDQAPRNAAALAYTTILSMVPLLAVSFALIKAVVPSGDMAQSVRDWMLGTLLADSVAEVGGILESFLERAQSGAVGLVGFAFLLFSALSAFLSAERAVNQIWRVPTSRPLHRRLITFYAVVTLTPALIGLGFVAARWIQSGMADLTFGLALSSTVTTWALEAMALALMFKLLPHTIVKKRAAIIGGVLAAIALELLKWGFNFYIRSVYTGGAQSKIYGSFALIPLLFLWIYLLWIVILAGVEVSYIIHNHRALSATVLHRRADLALAPPSPYLMSRIFFEVARRFQDKGGGVKPIELAEELRITVDEILPAVRKLCEAEMLLMVESAKRQEDLLVVPGRPLEQITLIDLERCCGEVGYRPGELPRTAPAEAFERALGEARAGYEGHLTVDIASLLKAPEAPADDAPHDTRSSTQPG